MLVLEAGGWDRDPWIHIPLAWGKILTHRLHDWMYFTEPEPNLGGPHDRMRARQGDRRLVLDQRHDLFARPPRRLRPLGGERPADRGPTPTRCPISRSRKPGRTAPAPIAAATARSAPAGRTFEDPLAEAYTAASQTAGLKWNTDLNSGNNEGIGRNQNTIRDGRRCSAAVAYLQSGDAAAQPYGRNRRAGVAHRDRGQSRRRRRIPQRRQRITVRVRARGAARGRRDQFAAGADAVGHRRPRRAPRRRHQAAGGGAGRRTEICRITSRR